VKLNLSGNNFGANGCQVLESFMVENQTIETLDISDNGMYCCCGDYEIE
jgi:Ran GTPase-activating protein (RanGAP) involved in mRNA processing and transport